MNRAVTSNVQGGFGEIDKKIQAAIKLIYRQNRKFIFKGLF